MFVGTGWHFGVYGEGTDVIADVGFAVFLLMLLRLFTQRLKGIRFNHNRFLLHTFSFIVY
jgi:hypothetical protein